LKPKHTHAERDEGHDYLDRNLLLSIVLNSVIVVAEVAGGIVSGSLALLSDAMHNMSDVAALFIALLARRFGRRPPSVRHTYGLKRLEVLAALANGAVLLVVSTVIAREAFSRLLHPQSVQGSLMFTVALIGLVANLASVFLLKSHVHGDLNMQSAFLHLVQDTFSSVIVVAVALLSGWRYGPYLDPLASLLVIVIIIRSGWTLLRQTLHILMEGTPAGLDLELLKQDIERRFPIRDLHHVHVWEVNSGQRILTAHLVFDDKPLVDVEMTLDAIRRHLIEEWSIEHATLEPEIARCQDRALIADSP
jgi:cobalt-zinc-cadmium efflux system protein